jgi:hypothetical protein
MTISIPELARRAAKGCATLLALGLLLSCGGGTEQITPFEPKRMLVLGDEMSVMTDLPPRGRKYSTNALSADNTTLDCVARPLWHQAVAYTFGFTYAECDPNGLGGNAAKIYAVPGAKVDDMPAQLLRARLANDGEWSNSDLFLVLVGVNDVLDLYQNVYLANPGTESYDAAIAELTARGVRLAQFINTLTRVEVTGPKVIVSTIPLMNQTPYAIKQAALHPGLDVLGVLNDFSKTFNTAMRAGDRANGYGGIVNDGRFIGLIELDGILNAGVSNPLNYGLTNITQAVCAVELPDCTVSVTDPTQGTLVPNGNATTWLWASDLWMGSTAHLNLGNFARGRATSLPF